MNATRFAKSLVGMSWWKRVLLWAATIVPIVAPPLCADEPDTAEGMLATYEATVGRGTAFRIEYQAKEWDNEALKVAPEKLADSYLHKKEATIVHEDFRWRIATVFRRTPRAGDRVQFARVTGVEYRFDEFLGVRQGLHVQWASSSADDPPRIENQAVMLPGEEKGDDHGRYLDWSDVVFGVTPCDARVPIWKVMREAGKLELLSEEQVIDQHPTRVLRSTGPYGTHTLYLDPKFGFLPRRVEVHKQNGHLWNDIQLGVEQTPSARVPAATRERLKARGMLQPNFEISDSSSLITNIQIEEKNGQFVTTAFDYVQKQTIKTEGRVEEKQEKTEYRGRVFEVNPENWPANAFDNSVDIPNGTAVRTPNPGRSLVWKDGKVE